jgi:Ser-tRNA(Ala) deacylase AlaX
VSGGDDALRYLRDAYAAEVETAVAEADGARVALRETPFYPGGGGQPADRGWVRWAAGESAVTAHARGEERLWHQLEDTAPPAGTAVTAAVDWPHRYAVMRHHTAVHVLSGIVYHLFGATVTGGQIYPDRARMDFALEDLNPERVAAIEREANRIIGERRPITVRFVSREEFEALDLVRTAKNLVPVHLTTIRVVEIEGFDAQADGGTHVRNTREIGALRVTKTENKGKINRRLEIALGD